MIDYKRVSFSFKAQKRKKLLKRIRVMALIVFIIFIYLILSHIVDAGKIKNIQMLLLENKRAEAAEKLEKSERSLFHKKSKKELKALLHLFTGDLDKAGEIFVSLNTKSTSIAFQKFLVYFSDHAEYRKLNIYTDYLMTRGENVLFYKILSNTGLLDFKESIKVFEKMSAEEKERYKQELDIIEKVNHQLKTGKINYIFDVNGIPMAYYDLKRRKTISLTPGLTFQAFNRDFNRSLKFYSLTIDIALQKKLHRLFKDKNYHGSFLLFNLSDTSIMVAYSKPFNRGKENAVFSETYEPGSIMKVLTLFSYLRSGRQELFPFFCKGNYLIKGKIFYDWINHGDVNTYDEAFSASCNICFARMGIHLGIKKLGTVFNKFYFNTDELTDLFLNFKTGTYNKRVAEDFQMANLSVGLEEISITTFHSALMTAIIAQNGSIYAPHLIKNKKNLLNLAYYNHLAQLLTVFNDNASFLKVKNAMIRVVEDKNGTGKRSKVDFVRVGLKTGTAGSKKKGLDAILIGFFPAEKPEYAFGFRLERVGRAELKGAYFSRDFLTAFYQRK